MTPLWQLGWTAGAFATATLIALALRRPILTGLPRWAPTSEVLSAGAKAFRGPSLWWCVVVGLYVANGVGEDFSLLPTRWHHQLGTALNIALVLSVTVTLAGLAGNLVPRPVARNMLGSGVTGGSLDVTPSYYVPAPSDQYLRSQERHVGPKSRS